MINSSNNISKTFNLPLFFDFRMNGFKIDKTFDDEHRVITYFPSFNTTSKLEFNILPDKRYLYLSETLLRFSIDIPSQMVPDNFLASTLFESLDIFINHELVTSKSSDNDYFVTDMVFMREGYNDTFTKSAMTIEGIFW